MPHGSRTIRREAAGSLPFGRVLYIDHDDFAEAPPKGWFRLTPGGEVRLRYACIIKCESVMKDERGAVVELRCTWDPESRGGDAKDGRKVKGTLHWVSEAHSVPAEVRLYDRLFKTERPGEAGGEGGEGGDFLADINPNSLTVERGARVEPALAAAKAGELVQFERVGYFCVDPDSRPGALVYNRTIGLRDSWAAKQAPSRPPMPAPSRPPSKVPSRPPKAAPRSTPSRAPRPTPRRGGGRRGARPRRDIPRKTATVVRCLLNPTRRAQRMRSARHPAPARVRHPPRRQ